MLPKVVVTDIDGVWTDGGMYYDQTGNEFKKFNTYDSAGILWCKLNNIKVIIATGENTKIVQRRADKLDVDYVFLGVKNKVQILNQLFNEINIKWSEIAYIGDDINDYHALEKSGFSACPMNSPSYIKNIVDYEVPVMGGDGAFRCFIEHILSREKLMTDTLDRYLSSSKLKFEQ